MEIVKIVKIPELEDQISKSGGGTWSKLLKAFYYTRLFKYVHKQQYRKIDNLFYKCTATKKLLVYCERGYLFSPQKDVYCATKKVDPFLKEADLGYVFPDEPKGKGDINELNNTDVFITLSKEEHFYTLLFPSFGYLIPDALLVEKNNDKYRLTCIEVEASKPDWNNWILEKKANYLKLSQDIQFYDWWITKCDKLGFKKPTIEEFKFNYKIIKQ
ncbi:MAG TPA: hypothetical protein VIL99_14735 [Ignavibacteria bacterium]